MYFFPNNIQIEKLIVCNDLTKVIGSRNLSRKNIWEMMENPNPNRYLFWSTFMSKLKQINIFHRIILQLKKNVHSFV